MGAIELDRMAWPDIKAEREAGRDTVVVAFGTTEQHSPRLPLATDALIDYEKMFCPDLEGDDIFDLRQVNRETGCMIVVRPDQYVSHVLPLDGHEALTDFFAGILIEAEDT